MKQTVKRTTGRFLISLLAPLVRLLLQYPNLWEERVPKELAWQLAETFDLRVNKHCVAQGQNLLTIEGGEYAKQHQIPKSVYFNTRSGCITVGENSVFGEDVMVLTGKHYNVSEAAEANLPLHYVPESGRDIKIGKGCYIGSGAIILGPVQLGDYAVVGAGSVVTKDVPPRALVAGVPAHVIKML